MIASAITPTRILYEEYLVSADWRRQRESAFERWGNFCNSCGRSRDLQAHHLFYRNLHDCVPNDLMPLCGACHDILHRTPLPYSVSDEGDHMDKRRLTLKRLTPKSAMRERQEN